MRDGSGGYTGTDEMSDPNDNPPGNPLSERRPGPEETICHGCRGIIRSSAWTCPCCGTIFEGLSLATLTPKSLTGPAKEAYWKGFQDCKAHGQPAGVEFGDTRVSVPEYQPPRGFEDAYRAGWKSAADKLGARADRRAGRHRGLTLILGGVACACIPRIAHDWGITEPLLLGFVVVGLVSIAAGTLMVITGESDE